MTRSVSVMPAPDPDTCTPEAWDGYLESTDVTAMTWGEVETHRALVERYTARLLREQSMSRAETVRLLDARDATSAEAEAVSARCRRLHREMLELGDAVLQARRDYPADSHQVLDAQECYDQASAALSLARTELATANLRAIQASIDAR